MDVNVLIVVPTLAERDAIGGDVLFSARALMSAGYRVYIYAEFVDEALRAQVIGKGKALLLLEQKNTIFFYHMGVYCQWLPKFVETAKGPLIVKFHNFTPPEYFQAYDKNSTYATAAGIAQLAWLLKSGRVDLFLGASSFNIQEARAFTTDFPRSDVLAPYIPFDELSHVSENRRLVEQFFSDDTLSVAIVGRLVPNKGHVNALGVLAAYRELYSKKIQLLICGKISPAFQAYKNRLDTLSRQLNATSRVHFLQDLSVSDLATVYRKSHAYLCMSWHEGFCVPVVEAQALGLPVVAFAKAAVPETVGAGGIVLKTLDYDLFATALSELASKGEVRAKICAEGKKNTDRFTSKALSANLCRHIASVL